MHRKKTNNEITLLHRALDAFREATGLPMEVETLHAIDPNGRRVDAVLRLRHRGLKQRVVAEIKPRLTNTILGMAHTQLEGAAHPGMIITEYVNPLMAERIRRLDLAFIDTVGNAFLNAPPVYVFIKGNRIPVDLTKGKKTRAFQATGLKVIFAFLCRPELVNAPYRDIAELAGVALGTVNWVVRDLREQGFLMTLHKGERQLRNRRDLFNRWVEAYPEQLRPKLNRGRFRAREPDWWKTAALKPGQAYWGGEIAAAKLTRYLRPGHVTLYFRRGENAEIILKNKLRRDPNGNTELVRAFWNNDFDWTDNAIVPPLLTYADLMATGDPRNVETAKILYEQEITGPIGEG